MKRFEKVVVTDPESDLFGQEVNFLFKANENYVHVVRDEQVFQLHRLAISPVIQIQSDVLKNVMDGINGILEEMRKDLAYAEEHRTPYAIGAKWQARADISKIERFLESVKYGK
jgi:hypothetical protein